MGCEGLIDDSRVLIACSMNPETAVTFTHGHFNKVVFAVYIALSTWYTTPYHQVACTRTEPENTRT